MKKHHLWKLVVLAGLLIAACRPSSSTGESEADPNRAPLIRVEKDPPPKEAEGKKDEASSQGVCHDLTENWYGCIFEESFNMSIPGAPSIGAREPLVSMILFWSLFCPDCSLLISEIFPGFLKNHPDDIRITLATLPSHAHPLDMEVMQIALEIRAQKGEDAFWKFLQAVHAQSDRMYVQERLLEGERRDVALKMFGKRCEDPAAEAVVNILKLCHRDHADCKSYEACVHQHFASLRSGKPVGENQDREATCERIVKDRFDCIIKDYVFDIPVEDSPQIGPSEALVTVVVFSDFECPYCSQVAKILDKIQKAHHRNVRIVFKNYPLNYHRNGLLASKLGASVYAKKGSAAFFRFHDQVFENQENLSRDVLIQLAGKAGINKEEAASIMNSRLPVARIDNDKMLGDLLRVEGTPTVFINGVPTNLREDLEKSILAEVRRVEKEFPKNKRKNVYASIVQQGRRDLDKLVTASGIDKNQLERNLKSGIHKKEIEDQRALGATRCTRMPCFAVNGKVITSDIRPLLPRFLDEAHLALKDGIARTALPDHLARQQNLIQTLSRDSNILETDVFGFLDHCEKPQGEWETYMPAFLACSRAEKNCERFRRCVMNHLKQGKTK